MTVSRPAQPGAMLSASATARLRRWVTDFRTERRSRRLSAAAGARPAQPSPAEPLSRLVSLVRETATQISACLELFRNLQSNFARGVQDFLVLDSAGLDDPALGLLRICLTLFQECEPLLKGEGLQRLSTYWDHVAEDCENIAGIVRSRDEAFRELRHYEEKVAWLKTRAGHAPPSGASDSEEEIGGELLPEAPVRRRDRLSRNQEKLSRARGLVETNRAAWEAELRAFEGRRAGHARALLLGLLGGYCRLLGDFGSQAADAAEALEGELKPGTAVRVMGLPGHEAGGCPATFTNTEEGTGRCVVSLQDGEKTAVRPESICPAGPAEVSLEPARGPCSSGCEADVRCSGLDGPVSEVLVNGQHVEVLSATCWGARIRLPPCAVKGHVRVEVRAARWRQRVAVAEAGFQYYEPIGFGPHGKNIQLAAEPGAPAGPEATKALATRVSGLLDGVALTASPLPAVPLEGLPQVVRYYYEIEVQEVAQRVTGTTRTLSLGFAWSGQRPQAPLVQEASGGCFAGIAAASTSASSTRMPEMARNLPRAFVVGGDLPRVYLAGKELSKVTGWRPLFDVGAGAVLGALLQVQTGTARLTILQDGVVRCAVDAELPDGRWDGPPHGAVDVCGTVQRVALRQGVEIPRAALQGACGEAPAPGPSSPSGARGTAQRRCLSMESSGPARPRD